MFQSTTPLPLPEGLAEVLGVEGIDHAAAQAVPEEPPELVVAVAAERAVAVAVQLLALGVDDQAGVGVQEKVAVVEEDRVPERVGVPGERVGAAAKEADDHLGDVRPQAGRGVALRIQIDEERLFAG